MKRAMLFSSLVLAATIFGGDPCYAAKGKWEQLYESAKQARSLGGSEKGKSIILQAMKPYPKNGAEWARGQLQLAKLYELDSDYYTATKKANQALAVFRRLQLPDDTVSCLYELAWCAQNLGEYAQGLSLSQQSLQVKGAKIEPTLRSYILFDQAKMLQSLDKTEEAIAVFKQLLSTEVRTDVLLPLANCYISLNQSNNCAPLWVEWLSKEKFKANDADQFSTLIKIIETAQKNPVDENLIQAATSKLDVVIDLKLIDEVVNIASKEDGSFALQQLVLERAKAKYEKITPQPEALLRTTGMLAHVYGKNQKIEQALVTIDEYLKQIDRIDLSDVDVYIYQRTVAGELLSEIEKKSQAIECFQKALRLSTEKKGRWSTSTKQLNSSLIKLLPEASLQEFGDSIVADFQKADAECLSSIDELQELADRYAKSSPEKCPAVLMVKAETLIRTGAEPDSCIDALTKCQEASLKCVPADNDRLLKSLMLHIAILNQQMAIDDRFLKLNDALAAVLLKMDKPDEAETCINLSLDTIRQLYGENSIYLVAPLMKLSEIPKLQDDALARAEKIVQTNSEKNSNRAALYSRIAACAFKKGDYEKCTIALEKALSELDSLDPSDSRRYALIYSMVVAKQKVGQDTRQVFEKYFSKRSPADAEKSKGE